MVARGVRSRRRLEPLVERQKKTVAPGGAIARAVSSNRRVFSNGDDSEIR